MSFSPGGRDLASLFRRLHVMFISGIPLHLALSHLADSEPEPMADILRQSVVQVETGRMLSQALGMHGWVFPPVCVHLIAAGEKCGGLGHSLACVADYLERSWRIRARLVSTLTYPACLLVLTLVLLILMGLYVLPREQSYLREQGAELPALTGLLMGAAQFLTHPVTLLMGLFLVARLISMHRYGIGRWVLRLPVVGPALTKVAVARMLTALAAMLESGMVLTQTGEVARVSGHPGLAERYQRLLDGLKDGLTLGEALDSSEAFPALVRHLFRAGEEHGQLAYVARKAAQMYEEDSEHALELLATLLEPLALLFLGGCVGVVVLATLGPTMQVVTL